MKIILNQDVVNLGEEGDVCVVKDGYARNYLLPTGAAVIYNKTNAALFASRAEAIEKRKVAKRAEAASLKEKLDAVTLELVVPAGESGKLFGSVTSIMVQDALNKLGFEIERKKIEVQTHAIKMTGTYTVTVHLYENESSQIKLVVLSDADVKERARKAAEEEAKAKAEAEAQAKAEAEAEAAAKAEAEETPSEDAAPSEAEVEEAKEE
ncbi:MAG TPA: 50S ribosomal protein L9 [Candidatus Ornithospirochaeta stercorigallinarum]|nr:50S ribosomal protein L9 [Candidatus Ornithospirochaeta stercorigallinarum]